MVCGAPDPGLGTAQRYAVWFDCNARVLGQEGFLGLTSYVVTSGVLTGALTIFIALIGYRLLLGGKVDLSDGVSWTVKVGVVLALVAGWSAFQTLFYQLAIAGPGELAERFTLAAGIPVDETGARFQRVYDALRLGLEGNYSNIDPDSGARSQPALPLTAVTFLIVTIGTVGAAKLAAGFLLAIATIPILAMLFGPGMGIFVGWLRALIAVILAAAGLTVNALWCLLAMESEVSRMQGLGLVRPGLMDEQAPLAVALIFLLISFAIVLLCVKITRGLAENIWTPMLFREAKGGAHLIRSEQMQSSSASVAQAERAFTHSVSAPAQSARSYQLAQAFDRGAREDSGFAPASIRQQPASAQKSAGRSGSYNTDGAASRRALGRRHRSSIRRDRNG